MAQLNFWKPGTVVRIKETGEEGVIHAYMGDGFYRVIAGDLDGFGNYNLHVEDLELIKEAE